MYDEGEDGRGGQSKELERRYEEGHLASAVSLFTLMVFSLQKFIDP